jgi:hypothetical protein
MNSFEQIAARFFEA